MDIQSIKQRFGIIGNSSKLIRAIDIAQQVAPTDITVLITGESGTGKEIMPQIIHAISHRKHNKYIAVNCGAIPEGTIDSELFGHEKGSFTGATESRKGYFEVVDGGTIFLDEIAELPLQTQVRLLRVLESGEYIRVGSSKIQKTDVRVVAATNKDIPTEIHKGRFREDLYYRLSTIPIHLPSLRERKDDVLLLFRKFASDFSEKYRMPSLVLDEEAQKTLTEYNWPGNIRQLKNITEQMSVIESERSVSKEILLKYLPNASISNLPAVLDKKGGSAEFSEREILYKVLFDMRNDLTQLKSLVLDMLKNGDKFKLSNEDVAFVQQMDRGIESKFDKSDAKPAIYIEDNRNRSEPSVQMHEEVEESLSLADKEKEMIERALKRHRNKRKYAAKELGISERTLYRKIKEYDIN